jgi:hypothetical protein
VVVNLTYYIVWIIQNSQNDVIFSERTTFVDYLVDKVIISSWKSFRNKNYGTLYSFWLLWAEDILYFILKPLELIYWNVSMALVDYRASWYMFCLSSWSFLLFMNSQIFSWLKCWVVLVFWALAWCFVFPCWYSCVIVFYLGTIKGLYFTNIKAKINKIFI